MPEALRDVLASVVRARVSDGAASWLEDSRAAAVSDPGGAAFRAAFAGAGRRLGRSPITVSPEEREALRAAGLPVLPPDLGRDECGRGALVLDAASRLPESARADLVRDLFQRADVRERQAVLRILAYLPRPEAFLETAVEACRSSVEPVFEAIAGENPYPARHFPEASFNALVLKALFIGVPLERVFDLDRRLTDDLVRMAEAYARERRAAGRAVPADVGWLTARTRRSP